MTLPALLLILDFLRGAAGEIPTASFCELLLLLFLLLFSAIFKDGEEDFVVVTLPAPTGGCCCCWFIGEDSVLVAGFLLLLLLACWLEVLFLMGVVAEVDVNFFLELEGVVVVPLEGGEAFVTVGFDTPLPGGDLLPPPAVVVEDGRVDPVGEALPDDGGLGW